MHNYYTLIKAFEKTKSTAHEEQYPRLTSDYHINGRAGDEPRNSGIFTMTFALSELHLWFYNFLYCSRGLSGKGHVNTMQYCMGRKQTPIAASLTLPPESKVTYCVCAHTCASGDQTQGLGMLASAVPLSHTPPLWMVMEAAPGWVRETTPQVTWASCFW